MARFERLSRLLEILFQIRENPKLRARDLAVHFGVSEKRIFDDLKELQRAGIPISFVNGGYQVHDSLFTSSGAFTLDEAARVIQGLVRLGADGILSESDMARLVAKVLPPGGERLMGGNPRYSVSAGERARNVVDPEVVTQINETVASRKKIEIRYRSRKDSEPRWREVHPYHVAHRKDAWYLIAYCPENQEIRTFKISRIAEVRSLHEAFEIPEDFSPKNYLKYRWRIFDGPGTVVCVRFDAEVGDLILEKEMDEARVWEDEGNVYLEATVTSLDEFSWWLLQYGEHAEVLQPRELRTIMAERARQLASLYGV